MNLSDDTRRRAVTFLPPLLMAVLVIPFIVRQNAWYEWENAYWLLQRQAEHVSAHGVPSYVLHTRSGSFNPFNLFYAGFTVSLLAYPAALLGAWPVFVGSMVAAVVAGYLGVWWTARNLGLSRAMAVLPALVFATTPYVLSDVYGRGAWAELIGANAVPVLLAGWTSLLLHPGRRPGWALLAIAGASALVAGTHTLTLLMTGVVLPLVVLAVLPYVSDRVARGDLLRPIGLGLAGVVVGGGLTAAWLVPSLWLGPHTDIANSSINREGLVATAPFARAGNLLSPWPVVPSEFKGSMWIYSQAPVLAMIWGLVAAGVIVRWRRDVTRGLLASVVGLVALGFALTLLIASPGAWLHFPKLAQTIQMPIRLVPYLALTVAVGLAVALMALPHIPVRRVLVGALVGIVGVQIAAAAYVAVSSEPGFALTATAIKHGQVRVGDEPKPFSGPGEIVTRQFWRTHAPENDLGTTSDVHTRLAKVTSSDAGTLAGRGKVGDLLQTGIVWSPVVRFSGDARQAGRSDDGRVILEVTRTGAAGAWHATARTRCILCAATITSSMAWQLRLGQLLTLLSLLAAVTLAVVLWRQPREAPPAEPEAPPVERLPVQRTAKRAGAGGRAPR